MSCPVREIRQCRLTIEHSCELRGDGEALLGSAGSRTCNGSHDDQSENLPAWRAETNDRALARKPRPDRYFWRAWLSAGSRRQAKVPSFRAAVTLQVQLKSLQRQPTQATHDELAIDASSGPHIDLRYLPPTSNSACVICPSEHTRTASTSTSNTLPPSMAVCFKRSSMGPLSAACLC